LPKSYHCFAEISFAFHSIDTEKNPFFLLFFSNGKIFGMKKILTKFYGPNFGP
jgi:hypothetical protein